MGNYRSGTVHWFNCSSHQQYLPDQAGARQLSQKFFRPVTGRCRRDFCSFLKNGERRVFGSTGCNQHYSVFCLSPHSLLYTSGVDKHVIKKSILLFEPIVDWVHSRHCVCLSVDRFGTMQALRANHFIPSTS